VALECLALFRLWREVEDSQLVADTARSAATQLLKVQQVKERLLRVASHELNTPLTPIKIQLRLMSDPSFLKDAPRREAIIRILERNFGRLERVVTSVLDVVRIDNDKIRIQLKTQDVASLAKSSIDAYAEVAQVKNINIGTDFLPSMATVDGERVSQVFDNLLSNAIKYTPEGGEIIMRVRPVDEDIIIEVEDTGAGLTAAQILQLFEPFGMVHGDDDVRGGTGLGLYVCKGIVEAHGGMVGALSAGPGRGTTFWARLPAGIA